MPSQKKLADLVGLTTLDHLPAIALIHPHNGTIEKYLLTESDLNSETMSYAQLNGYLHEHKQGKLKRHLRVQDEQESISLNGSVYELKGQGKLLEFINKPHVDIVVLYYVPYCYHCQMMLPEYEKLAEILKNATKTVLFGRIDVSQNDITDHDAKRYPAVKVYR